MGEIEMQRRHGDGTRARRRQIGVGTTAIVAEEVADPQIGPVERDP